MHLIRGVNGLGGRGAGCAVTIGTYDGIHLGHQALLRRVREHAARLATPAVLLTFEPMPREYLVPADPPARLTSLRERWRILAPLGVDYLWLLRFNEALRNLSAEGFAQLLVRELAPRVVVVGHDFRFARHGEATAPMLAEAGKRLGFEVEVLPAVTLEGERISSSGVRAALDTQIVYPPIETGTLRTWVAVGGSPSTACQPSFPPKSTALRSSINVVFGASS